MLLWLHAGHERVEPYMQALHFCFGLGAFIAPLLVGSLADSYGSSSAAFYAMAFFFIPTGIALWRSQSPRAPSTKNNKTMNNNGDTNNKTSPNGYPSVRLTITTDNDPATPDDIQYISGHDTNIIANNIMIGGGGIASGGTDNIPIATHVNGIHGFFSPEGGPVNDQQHLLSQHTPNSTNDTTSTPVNTYDNHTNGNGKSDHRETSISLTGDHRDTNGFVSVALGSPNNHQPGSSGSHNGDSLHKHAPSGLSLSKVNLIGPTPPHSPVPLVANIDEVSAEIAERRCVPQCSLGSFTYRERWIIALTCIMLCFYVGNEVTEGSYLYTYAVKRDMLTPHAASMLNAAFWGSLAFGRLVVRYPFPQ
jgi:hypothetical protein